MNQEEIQAAQAAAKTAQRRDAGLEPKRTTYYASWVVKKTGGIARYVHGPASKPVIYYKGPCQDCGCEFVTTRQPARYKALGNGRWPSYCRSCNEARCQEHNRRGTERKRAWRERKRAEQWEQFGGKPPRGYAVR